MRTILNSLKDGMGKKTVRKVLAEVLAKNIIKPLFRNFGE